MRVYKTDMEQNQFA